MVEDDKNFGAVLKSYLEIHDYEVTWIDDGKYAFDQYLKSDFDICILDVMLPNVDGFTIARQIRDHNKNIPLLFLTAKSLKKDVIEGFSIGADDYITKPFDSEVLLLKIQAILKRSQSTVNKSPDSNEFKIGKLDFDYSSRIIKGDTKEIKLSPKESELLKLLCKYKDAVLSREEALKKIWGEDNYFTTRSMDVFLSKLRKHLASDPSIEIINIHGSGYKLTIK